MKTLGVDDTIIYKKPHRRCFSFYTVVNSYIYLVY